MADTDWIGIFAIILLLLGASLISYYLITKEIAKCTGDPIKYAVDEAIKNNEFYKNYSYVRIEIYYEKNDSIPIDILEIEL